MSCIESTSRKIPSTAAFPSVGATRIVGGPAGAWCSMCDSAGARVAGDSGRRCRSIGAGISFCGGGGSGVSSAKVVGSSGSSSTCVPKACSASSVCRTRSTSASDRNGFSIVATTFGKRAAVAFISVTCPDIINTGTCAVRSLSRRRSQSSSPLKSGRL